MKVLLVLCLSAAILGLLFLLVLIAAHLADIHQELSEIRKGIDRIADVQECLYDER